MPPLSVPVNKANEVFDARFEVFKHSDLGRHLVRTRSCSIPADLKAHLALVRLTTSYVNIPLFPQQSPFLTM